MSAPPLSSETVDAAPPSVLVASPVAGSGLPDVLVSGGPLGSEPLVVVPWTSVVPPASVAEVTLAGPSGSFELDAQASAHTKRTADLDEWMHAMGVSRHPCGLFGFIRTIATQSTALGGQEESMGEARGCDGIRPAWPDEETRALAGLQDRLFRRFEVPRRLHRYDLLERVGSGGGGIVYAGYDPQLERKVAIKLLRGIADERAQLRLVREAQALAKLAHPNVVTVFDVGTYETAGSSGEPPRTVVPDTAVFIVMEYVDGPTLADWLRERRSRRAVLEHFLAAGRGLAAAHALGIVHRDFKPHNVVIGRDGRARVLDFGLSRVLACDVGSRTPLDDSSVATSAANGAHSLTDFGTVMGTPAYMAPEQHVAEAVDARADQFAFCVALFEALHGQRPFVGVGMSELVRAKQQGDVRAGTKRLPRRIARALAKGLAPRPEDRHRDLATLLARLEPNRGRTWAWVAGLVVLAVLASAWMAELRRPTFTSCETARDEWTRSVPGVAGCRDDEALAREAIPPDPESAEAVGRVAAELVTLRARVLTGEELRAVAIGRAAVETADASGHAPSRVRARYALAWALSRTGNLQGAEQELRAGWLLAEAQGLDDLQIRGALDLSGVLRERGRASEADAMLDVASAKASRAPQPAGLASDFAVQRGRSHLDAGRIELAIASFDEALAAREALFGPDHVAIAWTSLDLARAHARAKMAVDVRRDLRRATNVLALYPPSALANAELLAAEAELAELEGRAADDG
jgi:serine/threonine protein kinase